MRSAVGDDMALMADYNQGLNFAEALQRCHMVDDLGLAWIEEPIVYDNLDGYAQLTAQLKTPIQIGENFYGPRELHKALQRNACDLVMPDFMRIGGVTGWLRAAAIAGAAGIPMSTHLYPEVGAHVMRVTETAHWLEWQDWADPILQRPYAIRDGLLHIPDAPGLGLDWNEDAVKAHAFDAAQSSTFAHRPGAAAAGPCPLAGRAILHERTGIGLLALARLALAGAIAEETDFSVLNDALDDRIGPRPGTARPF